MVLRYIFLLFRNAMDFYLLVDPTLYVYGYMNWIVIVITRFYISLPSNFN